MVSILHFSGLHYCVLQGGFLQGSALVRLNKLPNEFHHLRRQRRAILDGHTAKSHSQPLRVRWRSSQKRRQVNDSILFQHHGLTPNFDCCGPS